MFNGTVVAVGGKVAAGPIPLGTADFMVHHIHAFTIHVTVLILLGQVMELKARSQTSGAIKRLLGLAPKTARRINADGAEEDVPLTHVHVGDSLRVRPGEKVPVDGVVIVNAAQTNNV